MRRRRAATAGLLGLAAAASVVIGAGPTQAGAQPAVPASSAGTYVPVTPARTLDTRSHTGASAPAARGTVSWAVTGHGGIPATGVSAVVVNLSVLSPPAGGYVTAWADGVARPTASSISYSAHKSETVLAVAPIGSDGRIALYNGSAATQQIVGDVAGYYVSGQATTPGAFTSVGPARTLDTRTSVGAREPAARQTVTWQATGAGGVPSSGVSAVVVNLSVLSPASGGYVTAFADGTTRPTASSISYSAHKTENVLVEVPVSAGGRVALYNGSATAQQLVGDVAGYYLAGTPTATGTFVPLAPNRALDTRTPTGAAPPAAKGTVTWAATGHGGVPATGVSAVVFNLSVLSPASSGYVVAYPDRTLRPTASSISYTAHKSENNLVVVPVGSDGRIAFYNGSATTQQLVGDVAGYYRAAPPLTWSAPTSVMPSQGGMSAVSCASATFCTAVDDAGDALTYDGSAWTAPAKIDTAGLLVDVSCPTVTFCVAVDGSSNALSWNGTSWSAPSLVDGSTYLAAVSCASSTFCVAVDGNGSALTYDGSAWSAPHVVDTANALDDVSCVSSTFCVATDGSESTYSVFTGTTWTKPKGSPASGFHLSCASTAFCLATDGLNAATFDGTSWSRADDPSSDVQALSCPADGSCTAVNSNGEALDFASSAWSAPTVLEHDSDQGLRGVSCVSTTCVTVGDDAYVRQAGSWDAGSDVDPTSGGITTTDCPTVSFCVAGNDSAQVSTWTAGTWSAPQSLDPAGRPYSAGLSCASASFCLLADSADHSFVYDGASWTAAAATGGEDVSRLSCATASFCIGVANGVDLVRWNGSTWTLSTRLATPLADVSCPAAGFCVAASISGAAYTWNGSTWSAGTSVDPNARAQAVSCSSSAACVLVDAQGQAVTYRDGMWAAPLTVAPSGLADVSCATDRSCVAVTATSDGVTPGAAIAFDGVVWSAPVTIDPSPTLDTVACATSTFCVAGDGQGRVIRGASAG